MYKPHEAFEEELEALVQDPDEDEGFRCMNIDLLLYVSGYPETLRIGVAVL